MRTFAALVVFVAVALTGPVLAGGAQREGRIDTQTFIWTNEEATTSSMSWKDVPGLSFLSRATASPGATA